MRVLQVYRDHFSDLPGGIERHVDDIAHGLRPHVDVSILASARSRRPRYFVDRGVPVHLVPEYARIQGIPLAPGFRRALRGGHDIVHLHVPNPTAELAFLSGRRAAAGVLTYHSDLWKVPALFPVYKRFLTAVMARCARVIVSSEQLIDASPLLSAFRTKRPEALAVIPFGVDTDRFSPGPTTESQRLREAWDSHGSGLPVVLFVGRLRYYKGLPVLIEALRDRRAVCVVAGDGPERGSIERAGRAALGERFVLMPGIDDRLLPEVYRAADVFCLPSTSAAETFGISMLEAMASGLPAVSTELGTATSVINDHGRTGVVVAPGDAGSLRAALDDLLADPSRRRSMGAAARDRVVAEYSLRIMIEATLELYQGVAVARGKPQPGNMDE